MKKLIGLGLLLSATLAFAEMRDVTYSVSVVGTETNSKSYVVRGEIMAIRVTVPEGATGNITVATSEQTILSKSGVSASTTYYPKVATHNTSGTAISFVDFASNSVPLYANPVSAGLLTTTVVGASAGTNTYTIKVIVKE